MKLTSLCILLLDTLENIKELPHKIQKVDVIISEFMGYALFYEAMANTVIVARDRWLKPGGVILPDKCSLFIFGITDAEFKIQRIQFWEDVKVGKDDWYDFSPMTSLAMRRVWKRTLSYEKHVNFIKITFLEAIFLNFYHRYCRSLQTLSNW